MWTILTASPARQPAPPVAPSSAARRVPRNATPAAFPLFCAALLLACFGSGAAAPAPDAQLAAPAALASPPFAPRTNSSFAIADFNGDTRPDLATAEIERSGVQTTRYLIRLEFNSGAGPSRPSRQPGQSIGVTGAFGLPQISAIDVNGDRALDLVVTAAGQPQPIAVLLNDGRGEFSLASPGEFPATAAESPWRWDLAQRQVQDLAALISLRTPQAEAAQARQSLAPRQRAKSRFSATREVPNDPLLSSSLGRAPPSLA